MSAAGGIPIRSKFGRHGCARTHSIQIRPLVNGATILQEPMEQVTYYHVELARHDVLTAEGLAAKRYLDTGSQAA